MIHLSLGACESLLDVAAPCGQVEDVRGPSPGSALPCHQGTAVTPHSLGSPPLSSPFLLGEMEFLYCWHMKEIGVFLLQAIESRLHSVPE